MEILKNVLGELSLDVFLQKYFNHIPLSLPHSANDYRKYLNWSVVEAILQEKKSMIRVVKEGRMVLDDAKLSYAEARDLHTSGHTLVIKNSERSHSYLQELAEQFSSYFFAPVDIQVFCSPAQTHGFGWHYDVEDVFIFQTEGMKKFSLRQNTIHPHPTTFSTPKDLGFENEKSDIYIETTLLAGDWLYIPAGWWHRAWTVEEDSMHISLGVMSKTAIDIIPILIKELSQNSFWRTRLPLHQKFMSKEEEVIFYQQGMEELSKDIVRKLTERSSIEELLTKLRLSEGH